MRKLLIAMLLLLAMALTGCGENKNTDDNRENQSDVSDEGNVDASESGNIQIVGVADMFSNRDYETTYDENSSVLIQLNGTSASCDSDTVQIEGSTIRIIDEGTYIVRGTLKDGMIIVNAEDSDKPQIVLDNAEITSQTSSPIYILEADKVFITLAEGSENKLVSGGTFEAIDENNIDGTIFSKQDLTFNGNGKLAIESPTEHGIVCKDDVVFTSGTYEITSASHGIDANDSFRYTNAVITIAAGKDGVHVENEDDTTLGFVYVANGDLTITAEGDGISAGTYMQIDGGNFDILTGGGYENGEVKSSDMFGQFGGGGRGQMPGGGGMHGRSSDASGTTSNISSTDASSDTSEESTSIKGLKSDSDMAINGGTLKINSADDSLHSNASLTIAGGTFEIASGDDGIHAEDTLTISAGTINIAESYEGLEALHIKIAGGEIDLVSSDDGLNAAGGTDASGMGGRDQMHGGPGMGGMGSGSSNGTIIISGGNLHVNASGDGIDANGSLEISGGFTVVVGPTQGDTATLDYDTSAIIKGGTFIGTGSSMMAQTFSDSEQGVFAVQCGNCSAGTNILLEDAEGNEVISYAPELDFAVIIISTPEMVSGESYTITVGNYEPGTFEAN